MVRAAKEKGLPVTCEVTPHHLFLSEDDIDSTYNTSLKVNPPLRRGRPRGFLLKASRTAPSTPLSPTDPPHAEWEKANVPVRPLRYYRPRDEPCACSHQPGQAGRDGYSEMVELMAIAPREILGLEPVKIAEGSVADITVFFHPTVAWTVNDDEFVLESRTPASSDSSLRAREPNALVVALATSRTARSLNSSNERSLLRWGSCLSSRLLSWQ